MEVSDDEAFAAPPAVRWASALFFVSGATGLVWQAVWSRALHLLFGTSTFAVATVLSAFMAGLGLGGHLMARHGHRVRRPLRVYGVLELGIGAFGLLLPTLLRIVEPVWLWGHAAAGPVGTGLVQLVLVGALLVLPTAAMGATLPLLVAATPSASVGRLYAVNTAGAVVGTAVCGLWLLPTWGVSATVAVTAAANVVVGLAAWAVDRGGAQAMSARAGGAAPVDVLLSAAVTGFVGMAIEVAAFRVLGLTLGASVYAFCVMLLAFLIGIAAGGRFGGWLVEEVGDGARTALAVVLATLGLAVWATGRAVPELPFWYVWGYRIFDAEAAHAGQWALSLVISGLVLVPAATLLGAAFPLGVAAADDGGPVARTVARVYAANTAGGTLGAATAGFLWLPWLEVRGTFALAAVLAGVAALVLRPRRALAASAVAAIVLVVAAPMPWDPLRMTAGLYRYVGRLQDRGREAILDFAVRPYELLYYREGLSSVVTVARYPKTGNLWLANNGKIEASLSFDMPTQVLVSLLPMTETTTPERVLVIGLASGISAGAAGLPEVVRQLDVVELEPAIVPAARIFDAHNFGVLDDPRTHLVLEDGRQHVLRAAPHTWDVVVSEPSNPWLTGVSNLFTLDFFRLGRTRVKSGGVWSQWVQLYGLDDADLRSLLATFAEVWPNVHVYAGSKGSDLVLLGSDRPLSASPEGWRRLLEQPRARGALRQIGVEHEAAGLARFLFDRDGLLRFTGEVPLNTDDNLWIEHRAPLHLHRDAQSAINALLSLHAEVPAARWSPELLVGVADRWWDVGMVERSIDGLLDAAARTTDPLKRAAWVDAARARFVALQAGAEDTRYVSPLLRSLADEDFDRLELTPRGLSAAGDR